MITKNEDNNLKEENRALNDRVQINPKPKQIYSNCFPGFYPTLPDPEPIPKLEHHYQPFDQLHYLPFHYDDINYEQPPNIHQYYDHPLFQLKPGFYSENMQMYQDYPKIKRQQAQIGNIQEKCFLKEENYNHSVGEQASGFFKRQEDGEQSNFHIKYPDINKYFCLVAPKQEQDKKLIRKKKVAAYLQKKKQRSYSKKVIYKCRKDVADSRIRFKGRFISSKQASIILGLDPQEKVSTAVLKEKIKELDKKES